MPALATITGKLYRNHGPESELAWPNRKIRCYPLQLDESQAIVDSETVVVAYTDDEGFIHDKDGGPFQLWPGKWKFETGDKEDIIAVIHSGLTYELRVLRGYIAPPETTIQVVELPTDFAQDVEKSLSAADRAESAAATAVTAANAVSVSPSPEYDGTALRIGFPSYMFPRPHVVRLPLGA